MTGRMRRARDARGLIKRSEIEALARRIRRRFKPLKIVLFGSYAWGRPNRESDIDLLIVLRTRRHVSDMASDIACAVDPPFPIDILVRTPEEMRWRLAEKESFLAEVLGKGEVLYEAHHARVG